MSEVFKVPEEVIDRINEIFPNSEERRKLAYTLMFWNKKPNSAERQEMAEKVGRERSTVNLIIRALSEEGLFTNDFGSVPLFKHAEKMRLSLELPEDSEADIPPVGLLHETDILDLPEVSGEGEVEKGSQEVEKPPLSVEMPPSKELEKRIALTEVNIKGLKTDMEKGFKGIEEAIQRLSVAPGGDNPPENPGSEPVIQAENLGKIEQSGSVEDRLGRIEQLVQGREEKDPFADLSREQILELIRSQPQEFVAMVNPDGAGRTGRVEAQAVTLRPVILMLTTYSQMLYERAVHDGYFDGTLSDFANFTMEDYFTVRGWSLDWTKKEPTHRRRRFG